jgi:carbon monoxide dehydrogenase subunit G
MKLEQSFEVAAPVDRVWQALIDVEHVAPCLPGAAVTGRNEDGSYSGTFTVKIGPTTASYSGKLEMEKIDEGERRATMQAQGSDKRGQGGAAATIVSWLEPVDEGRTRVSVDTDYRITGRLARFGRGGMIEDISERLLREFAQRLQASLEGPGGETAPQAAPPEAASEDAAPEDAPAPVAPDEAVPPPTDAVAPTEAASETPADPPPPPPAPEPPPPPPAPEPPPPPPAPGPPPPPPGPPPPAAAPPPNEPLDAGSLVGSVILDRIKANPWPWIIGALVILRLLRRRH